MSMLYKLVIMLAPKGRETVWLMSVKYRVKIRIITVRFKVVYVEYKGNLFSLRFGVKENSTIYFLPLKAP